MSFAYSLLFSFTFFLAELAEVVTFAVINKYAC